MLSPEARRRLRAFRAHTRGYVSFVVLCVLSLVCAGAELIANDKPLLVVYQGEARFPLLTDYTDRDYGGDFDASADYADPDLIARIKGPDGSGVLMMPFVPFRSETINYAVQGQTPSPPDGVNLLGTDDHGRDVLANLIYGTRVALLFGLAVTVFSSAAGIAAGAVQGYFGGWTDLCFQRFIEIWSGLPELFVLVIVFSVVDPGLWLMAGLISLFSWPRLTGLVRAEVLRARNMPYVTAAKTLGVSEMTIAFRHILPNALTSAFSALPFVFTGSVATLAALDFLGFGMPPEAPSLGRLLAQGKANLQAPWLGVSVFCTLSALLTMLLFTGEAVRDAFDPRK